MVWLYMYNIDLYILLVLKGKQPLFLLLALYTSQVAAKRLAAKLF